MNLKNALAALGLMSMAVTGHAEVRTFHFTGTVSESFPMAPAGARVSGSFCYDTDAPADFTGGVPSGPGWGYAVYPALACKFTLRVGQHSASADIVYPRVDNNFGGNVEDSINIGTGPITLDGTYLLSGYMNLTFASGPGKSHALRNTELPDHIHLKKFDGGSYGSVITDGGQSYTLLFSIDTVTPVRRPGK